MYRTHWLPANQWKQPGSTDSRSICSGFYPYTWWAQLAPSEK